MEEVITRDASGMGKIGYRPTTALMWVKIYLPNWVGRAGIDMNSIPSLVSGPEVELHLYLQIPTRANIHLYPPNLPAYHPAYLHHNIIILISIINVV